MGLSDYVIEGASQFDKRFYFARVIFSESSAGQSSRYLSSQVNYTEICNLVRC